MSQVKCFYCGTFYTKQGLIQALGLLRDFKLGQYCKLPHRVTFIAQIGGAMVGSVLNYVMLISEWYRTQNYSPC